MKASLLLIGLLSAGIAFASPPAPKTQGIEGKDTSGTPKVAKN